MYYYCHYIYITQYSRHTPQCLVQCSRSKNKGLVTIMYSTYVNATIVTALNRSQYFINGHSWYITALRLDLAVLD